MKRIIQAGTIATAAWALASCTTESSSNPLGGEAGMRIEVEVYDGPLAKEKTVQEAELFGSLAYAVESLTDIERDMLVSQCNAGCFGHDGTTSYLALCAPAYQPSKIDTERVLHPRTSWLTLSRDWSLNKGNKDADRSLVRTEAAKAPGPNQNLSPYEPLGVNTLPNEYEWSEDNFVRADGARAHQCSALRDTKQDVIYARDAFRTLVCAIDNIPDATKPADFASRKFNQLYCQGLVKTDKQPGQGKEGELTNFGSAVQKLISEGVVNSDTGSISWFTGEGLKYAAELGYLLRTGAESWATTQIVNLSNDRQTRISLVRGTNLASDLGSEIVARADALMKQGGAGDGAGITKEILATSAYLRGAKSTDYLNLTDWFDATNESGVLADLGFSSQDRIRIIERLVADTHWTKINEVFAAGQGETAMAFVKDDVGNWNLKSFDNDPSELVDAYNKVGFQALKAAASLASGTKSLSLAKEKLDTANQVLFSRTVGAGQEATNINFLRNQFVTQLEALKKSQQDTAVSLATKDKDADQAIRIAKDGVDAPVSGARARRDAAKATLETRNTDIAVAVERQNRAKAAFAAAQGDRDSAQSQLSNLIGAGAPPTPLPLGPNASDEQKITFAREKALLDRHVEQIKYQNDRANTARANISTHQAEIDAQENLLTQHRAALPGLVETYEQRENDLRTASANLRAAEDESARVKQAIKDLPNATRTQVELLLRNYRAGIESLQAIAIAKSKPPSESSSTVDALRARTGG